LKANNLATFLRFTSQGDLGGWNPTIFLRTTVTKKKAKIAKRLGKKKSKDLTPQDLANAAQIDLDYWKKDNLIGIQAKLAANADYGKVLNLGSRHMIYGREHLPPAKEEALWLDLETLKYRFNHQHRALLLNTGDKLLVEFDKGAMIRHVHWGGCVDADGVTVHGENVMGRYLSMIRTRARTEGW
jgi:hypothetical protein